ncbi:hypothetical protein MASR1M12_08210 [Erysipelotrichia bacterium]
MSPVINTVAAFKICFNFAVINKAVHRLQSITERHFLILAAVFQVEEAHFAAGNIGEI